MLKIWFGSFALCILLLVLCVSCDKNREDDDGHGKLKTVPQITPTQGAILVGDGTYWRVLLPGTCGQVLTVNSNGNLIWHTMTSNGNIVQ